MDLIWKSYWGKTSTGIFWVVLVVIMLVGFIITNAISACHHLHYVIKFVSDLLQVGGFLRVLQFPPPKKIPPRYDTITLTLTSKFILWYNMCSNSIFRISLAGSNCLYWGNNPVMLGWLLSLSHVKLNFLSNSQI